MNHNTVTQIIGTFIILALALFANHPFIYGIAIIIIATLVTKLQFLEKLMALIWHRDKYWEYASKQTELSYEQINKHTENINEQTKTELLQAVKQIQNDKFVLKDTLTATESERDEYLVKFHYEKTYRLIFGSQINILSTIKSYGNISRAVVEAIYRRLPIASTYDVNRYIGFMLNNFLIQYDVDKDVYILTKAGDGFLRYLEENIIPKQKPL